MRHNNHLAFLMGSLSRFRGLRRFTRRSAFVLGSLPSKTEVLTSSGKKSFDAGAPIWRTTGTGNWRRRGNSGRTAASAGRVTDETDYFRPTNRSMEQKVGLMRRKPDS